MPRIGRYFPNSKVSDWNSGAFGGGAAEAGLITATGGDFDGTYGAWKWHKFLSSADFTVTSGIGELELFMVQEAPAVEASKEEPKSESSSEKK